MTAYTFAGIKAAARGRWSEILMALGVDACAPDGRHRPCPGCGGRDRFRFDDRDGSGTWICGGGGNIQSGDGFGLLVHVHGWDPGQAFKAVAEYLGIRPTGKPNARRGPVLTRQLADDLATERLAWSLIKAAKERFALWQ